jgi:hypothetical protein
MLLRRAAVISAIATSLTLAFPAAGTAKGFRAHWKFDEIHSSTAFDSSRNHNDGNNFHVVGDGTGYTFNGINSRVVVPSSASLNPRFANFSFGVTLSMSSPPMPVGETYDVLRKGLSTTKGGDYKLEVENIKGNAVARCVVRSVRANGTKVLAFIQATRKTLADGKNHKITCSKTRTRISIAVGTRPVRTKVYARGLGSISNTFQLAVGAKAESSATTGFDWFKGVISNAWVR